MLTKTTKRILWITKDWPLLRQAASDLCQRYLQAPQQCGYLGAQGASLLAPLRSATAERVVYTTIQTWTSRALQPSGLPGAFDYVVIDEVHWGVQASSYRTLFRHHRHATFVGLTATPRRSMADWTVVGQPYGFSRLVEMGFLARPVLHVTPPTGISWSPRLSLTGGDFQSRSLRELASNRARNELIVRTYLAERDAYGPTLVFACDIEHAVGLAALFRARGALADVLHCEMGVDDRQQVLERFRAGRIRVLVNVAMLTHGVDIPSIESIFLARPTASSVLFSQMVGRGARRTPQKHSFRIVDFVDLLTQHNDLLIGARGYFDDVATTSPPTVEAGPRRERMAEHQFSPCPIELVVGTTGCERLNGLEIRPGQTFQLEVDLSPPTRLGAVSQSNRDAITAALLGALPAAIPRSVCPVGSDLSRWQARFVEGQGWVVKSPILRGVGSFEEVLEAFPCLLDAARTQELAAISGSTVLRLGWSPDWERMAALIDIVAYYEPAILSLVGPSRAEHPDCRSLRPVLGALTSLASLRALGPGSPARPRRLGLDFSELSQGVLSVRWHGGSLEADKVLAWTSLWMRLLEYAERLAPIQRRRKVPSGGTWPLSAAKDGDIEVLADEIGIHGPLRERLIARRNDLLETWWVRDHRYAGLATALLSERILPDLPFWIEE